MQPGQIRTVSVRLRHPAPKVESLCEGNVWLLYLQSAQTGNGILSDSVFMFVLVCLDLCPSRCYGGEERHPAGNEPVELQRPGGADRNAGTHGGPVAWYTLAFITLSFIHEEIIMK